MTIGEDRVRVAFNPSADSMVDRIKKLSANLIDLCETMRETKNGITQPGETQRLISEAQTCHEAAAMWAVKAATAP